MSEVQELFFKCLVTFNTSHLRVVAEEVVVPEFSNKFFWKTFSLVLGFKIVVGNLR